MSEPIQCPKCESRDIAYADSMPTKAKCLYCAYKWVVKTDELKTCKWTGSDMIARTTGCGKPVSTVASRNFIFCPYCGEKIKEVSE